MHMHNWVGEKIVCTVARKGFSLRSTAEKKQVLKNTLEQTINTNFFRSLHSQSTRKCPMTTDGSICADFSFSDGKTKKPMDNILLIISDVFNSGEF